MTVDVEAGIRRLEIKPNIHPKLKLELEAGEGGEVHDISVQQGLVSVVIVSHQPI